MLTENRIAPKKISTNFCVATSPRHPSSIHVWVWVMVGFPFLAPNVGTLQRIPIMEVKASQVPPKRTPHADVVFRFSHSVVFRHVPRPSSFHSFLDFPEVTNSV
uniref:HDC20431 n=1 Tax=Drosophila melanogaster TaxID=7227 RepID=Q6II08_DROME|nr:TPA_inf: HDC20431 [Drosophila melanogaster]